MIQDRPRGDAQDVAETTTIGTGSGTAGSPLANPESAGLKRVPQQRKQEMAADS